MDDDVVYEVGDRVAWLTIDRPEARNALSKSVRDGLWDGFRRFADDDDAAVLVLTGAGDKAFCAGGDLKEMADTAMRRPAAGLPALSAAHASTPTSRSSPPSTASPSPAASCSRRWSTS